MNLGYNVTLTQLGSSGSIIFETNFGFSFMADRYANGVGVVKRRPTPTARVLTLLSPCHQAAYKEDSQLPGFWRCAICRAELKTPLEFLKREYPTFEGNDLEVLELLISRCEVDNFETVLLAQSLIQIVEDIWAQIEAGVRVRVLLSRPEFSSAIEL